MAERALHSRYDPAGEAERFIGSLSIPAEVRFFILIEPGLGYMIPVIQRKFPGAVVVSLHAAAMVTENAGPAWFPESGIPVQEFLEREIPDTRADKVRIIEWRPSLAVYGKAYLALLREAAEFIKRIDANAGTVRFFGRRWFRNCLRNLGILRRVIPWSSAVFPRDRPWIITGAGPSLEETLPLIRKLKESEGAGILAASSSVPALAAGNVSPDMVISTDGGGWALFHLYAALRSGGAVPPALAVTLWAALPSQCGDLPVLPITDGSLWQRILLDAAGVEAAVFPQRGTVTASALDLVLALTGAPVFLAGMDLANRDIKTHARPYALDRFEEEGAGRLRPRFSGAFVRARTITASGSHGIYAAWFKGQLKAYPDRLFSLGANNPVFDALRREASPAVHPWSGTEAALPVCMPNKFGSKNSGSKNSGLDRAARALAAALERPETAGVLCKELGPLLLPDTEKPGPEALASEIQALREARERI